jgi:NAD+ diphosphatase
VPREIKEELGLDVVKAKYMSSRYHAKKELLMLNFIVVVEDKEIKIQEDEIAEARWCTLEEALVLIRKGTTAEFFLNNAVKELKKKI